MAVWGVKNFYVALENICEKGSEFSSGYFSLVVVAALLATGGLLVNSIPVIIGSMCIAPFLGPSRAVCIGGVYQKWKTASKGLVKQTVGLLAIGSTLGFFLTFAFQQFAPDITVTTEIIARTFPRLSSLYLSVFVAIASGVAASLVLVAEPKIVSGPLQQLLDVMIGVEIAISLIPPAAVVGIGFAFNQPEVSFQALGLLVINVVCIDFIAMLALYLRGVNLKLLQLEKKIRETTEKIINEDVKADEISTTVILQSHKKADVLVRIEASEGQCDAPQLLAEKISAEISKETGISNKVKIMTIPVCVYTS
jgi:uncharacterized hydrophobic protein (TIGR00271 family)